MGFSDAILKLRDDLATDKGLESLRKVFEKVEPKQVKWDKREFKIAQLCLVIITHDPSDLAITTPSTQ